MFFKLTNNKAVTLIRNCVHLQVRNLKYHDLIKKGFLLCHMSSGRGNPELMLVTQGCYQRPILLYLLSHCSYQIASIFKVPQGHRRSQCGGKKRARGGQKYAYQLRHLLRVFLGAPAQRQCLQLRSQLLPLSSSEPRKCSFSVGYIGTLTILGFC